MPFGISNITGVFLLMVVFGVESLSVRECQEGIGRESGAVEAAAKSGDRAAYRTHCPLLHDVISNCEVHFTEFEIPLMRNVYKTACDTYVGRLWLASSGSSRQAENYGFALVFLISILGYIQLH